MFSTLSLFPPMSNRPDYPPKCSFNFESTIPITHGLKLKVIVGLELDLSLAVVVWNGEV